MGVVAFTALAVWVGGGVTFAVHMIRAGARNVAAGAAQLPVPYPRRAADWPELRLDEVIVDPESAERILVVACWPAHPELHALLVLEIEDPVEPVHRLLLHWRDARASVAPRALVDDTIQLRRRRTNDTVSARVVAEAL